VGEIRNILWTASDDREVAKIDIYYRVGYGTPWRPIARDLPNTGSYSWRIPEDIHFPSEHGYVWCWVRVLAFDRKITLERIQMTTNLLSDLQKQVLLLYR